MNKIQQIELSTAMKIKYIDYALSVVLGRALPDVRDGSKWVHRRILFSMFELGLTPDKPYKKSARIVGDVLGKWHPHGDSSVYDAMVRMAQDFSMSIPLLDGHGNWGSQDGDEAAAYRYSEARLSKLALELLRDINKNTVNFIPNFDGEEEEPTVLPSRYPNLLVNGSEGIAVGLATKFPPHNLKDAIDTVVYQIDNPNCTIEDLVNILKAPDFPTKAEILNPKDMLDLYTNGHGKIVMRSKYHLEIEDKKTNIIFTEIPYQIAKSNLLDVLYSLNKEIIKKDKEKDVVIKAKIPEISEVIDESDKEVGIRINIKLKKNADVEKVLALLFKNSDLQCNYNAHFTAVYGTNQLLEHLSLKEINTYYINHQKEVISRRTQFDLDKANKRLHILNGLIKAIENIDETIKLIRNSKTNKEAKEKLCEFLSIDDIQSQAILDLKLQRLTGLEIDTLKKEYNDLLKTVEYLQSILNNEEKLLEVLKTELIVIRDKYGNVRRTQLVYENNIKAISTVDLIEQYNTKLILTEQNWIKKIPLTSLRGKGSDEQKLKENDVIVQEVDSCNKAVVYLFTNKSNRYKLNAYDIEDKSPKQMGEYIPNLIDLEPNEKVIKLVSLEDETKAQGYILSVFSNGKIAKVPIKSFISANKKLQNCYSIESELLDIHYINEDVDVLIVSSEGKGLIVNTTDIPSKQSRNTQGNIAMNLGETEGNKVISCMIKPNQSLNFTLITSKGKQKEFRLDDVAPTGKSFEQRNLYKYLSGKARNQGSFIHNSRTNGDLVEKVIYE
jgi:DNA gyrase subunit A